MVILPSLRRTLITALLSMATITAHAQTFLFERLEPVSVPAELAELAPKTAHQAWLNPRDFTLQYGDTLALNLEHTTLLYTLRYVERQRGTLEYQFARNDGNQRIHGLFNKEHDEKGASITARFVFGARRFSIHTVDGAYYFLTH